MEEKTRVASLSVASNILLTTGKIITGVLTGSVSILSEGIHSGIDLIASVIALFAVKESGKPADIRHSYGHGKIENVSGTAEAALIFVAAIWIIIEAVKKLSGDMTVVDTSYGLIIMGLSAAMNFIVSTLLMRVAKRTDSVALEADALHLRTDVYTSASVFGGLVLMKITHWELLDPIVAIAVALLIIKTAYGLTKEAFMPLVDVSLPLEEQDIIATIINRHAKDFVEFHELRTRRAGPERHIDLHLVVPKYTSVVQVHELCDEIELEINDQLPGTHVLIHAEPCTTIEESCPICENPEMCGRCGKKKSCRSKKELQKS